MKHDEQNYELLGFTLLAYKADHIIEAIRKYNKSSDPTSIYIYYTERINTEGISIKIVDKTLYITIELPA